MIRCYEDEFKTSPNKKYLKYNFKDEECKVNNKLEMNKDIKDLKRNLCDDKEIKDKFNEDAQSYEETIQIQKIQSSTIKSFENLESITNTNNSSSYLKKKIGKWTEHEDEILKDMVTNYGGKNWKKIAEFIKGRTPIQCLHRWTKILQPGLAKGPWSIQEDLKLIDWIKKEGPTRWSGCAQYVIGRNGKQCRERWFNSLNPDVKKGNWTAEEDFKLFFFYKIFGGKWSKIAEYFEGRTENSLKNRFYSTLRRIAAEKRKQYQLKEFELSNNPERIISQSFMNESNSNLCGLNELKNFILTAEEVVKYKLISKNELNNKDIFAYESRLLEMVKMNAEPTVKSVKSEKIINKLYKNSNVLKSTSKNTSNSNCNTNPNSKLNNSNINITFNIDTTDCNKNKHTNYHIGNDQNNFNSIPNNISFSNYLNNFNKISTSNNFSNVNNSSMTDNNINNNNSNNNYKNMDINSLEGEIAEMCDGPIFLKNTPMKNMESQIDNLLDSILNDRNNIFSNDHTRDWNFWGEKKTDYNSNFDFSKYWENSNLFNIENERANNIFKLDDGFKTPHVYNDLNSDASNNKKNILKSNSEHSMNNNDFFNNLLLQLNGLEQLVKSAKSELIKHERKDLFVNASNNFGSTSFDNLFKL